jgi:hypothetical protein
MLLPRRANDHPELKLYYTATSLLCPSGTMAKHKTNNSNIEGLNPATGDKMAKNGY